MVYVFWREDCSHCHEMLSYLDTLREEYPGLEVRSFEISNKSNRHLFMRMSEAYSVERNAVPTLFIGNTYIIGFLGDETSGNEIKALIENCIADRCIDPGEVLQKSFESTTMTGRSTEETSSIIKTTVTSGTSQLQPTEEMSDSPFSGSSRGRLLLFTVTIGVIDGFNACAIWAFCLLLGLLLRTGSRRRVVLIGGTFIIFSGLIYFGFLAAWLGFHLIFSYSGYMRLGIGVVILVIGVFSVKDFITGFRGVSLRIPDSKKPLIVERMRKVIRDDVSLPLLSIGVAALAVTVNLVELLCTAGLPAAYTRVLAEQGLSPFSHYSHLFLYVVFYMLDELVLLGGFVATMTAFRVGERYGRASRLLGGGVMIGLGLIMLFKPELLSFSL